LIPIEPKAAKKTMETYIWLTYFFYLPQVLYIMLLGMFSLYGYKAFGVDRFLRKKVNLYR